MVRSNDPETAAAAWEMLAEAGLVMQASFDVAALPEWVLEPITAAGVAVGDFRSLVLLGQAGTRLWEYLGEAQLRSGDHPFDDGSRWLGARFVTEFLGAVEWEVVYPGEMPLPLVRLAEMAGWGSPSPLGLTINHEYGLWLAHRVALLVDVPLPERVAAQFPHPCDSCRHRPCITACPAGAVTATAVFDVAACATHRVAAGSGCAYQCLARNACPVGAGHRYGPEQMAHHYGAGLESIRRYFELPPPPAAPPSLG